MNTRLKVISILFTIAYIVLVVDTVTTSVLPSFSAGFREGWDTAAYDHGNKKELTPYKTFSCDIQPNDGIYSFPNSAFNLKTEAKVLFEPTSIRVRIENPPKLSTGLVIARGIEYFVSFAWLFIIIFIPVQAYQIIHSIHKNIIFDERNIRRIRSIGYSLLIFFGFSIFYGFTESLMAKEMISMADYKIIFSMADEYGTLMLSLVVLLFAEVLRIATGIKEEQDLTV